MDYSGYNELVSMASDGAVAKVTLSPLIQAYIHDFSLRNRIGFSKVL